MITLPWLPCPFCGSKRISFTSFDKLCSGHCKDCGAESAVFDEEKKALAAWNRRKTFVENINVLD